MSSPGSSGPPPDPPRPHAPTTESEQQQEQEHSPSWPARTSFPATSAPPPDVASVAPETHATAAAASENPANRTPPPPSQNPGHTTGRRPVSSYTIIQPIGPRPDGEDDGNRVVLTWTIELFPNDDQEAPNADATGEVAVPNVDEDDTAASEGEAPAAAPQQGPAGGDNEAANTGERAAPAGFNPAAFFHPPGAPGGAADGERGNTGTLFFMIGPDGRVIPRPGGANDGQPPPFFFPFPLPFTFGPPPPAPDPAKAAELLASLPTVGRALLRRVDKIVAAEDAAGGKEYDERGWRCGICLEGLDSEAECEDPEQTVKGLPCNHLFHEECLQPWFTTHHTCPTCRLDLDPLRTLHPPRETRTNPLRPAATGSGRGTPAAGAHPYAREGRQQRSGRQTPANANANAAADGVQGQTPAAPGTPVNGPGGIPTPQSILESLVSQVTQAAFGAAMRNNQMFDNPITASPVPMERPEVAAGAARSGSPSPADPSAAPTIQTPAAQQVGNEAEGAGAAANSATARVNAARPTPERRPHIHFINTPRPMAGARNPEAAVGAGGPPPAAEAANAPPTGPGAPPASSDRPRHLHLPLEFLFFTPQAHALGRDALGHDDPGQETAAGPPDAPNAPGADAAAATPSSPVTTFVPQSLESWTMQREKSLGWRCEAIECLVAPPIPGGGAEDMDVDDSAGDDSELSVGDKDMLSIYAPTQALFDTKAAPDVTAAPGTTNYVLLACEHRWHRACLETAERSAGHSTAPDAEGYEWVRCPRCRKQGWITPRAATPAVAATTIVDA